MICFVTDKRPVSYNNRHRGEYQRELQAAFQPYRELYPELPLHGELSSNIVYIHKNVSNTLDVDNLSKPFVDAFNGIIYEDDSCIKHRECAIISSRDMDNIEIKYTNMNEKAAEELDQLLEHQAEHILYFAVYNFSHKQVKIGGECDEIR